MAEKHPATKKDN